MLVFDGDRRRFKRMRATDGLRAQDGGSLRTGSARGAYQLGYASETIGYHRHGVRDSVWLCLTSVDGKVEFGAEDGVSCATGVKGRDG